MNELHCCPRCGRQNESRAKYCAMCGLNLPAAGVDLNAHIRRTSRRSGRWLVLFILLFGLSALLGMFVSVRRVGPPRAHRTIIQPTTVDEIREEAEDRAFHRQAEMTWEKEYPRRPRSGRIPSH